MRSSHWRAAVTRDVCEPPISEVSEHEARPAIGILPEIPFNLWIHAASRNQNVWPAVVVQVNQSRSPLYVANMIKTRLARSIFKEALASISIQRRQIIGK